MEKILDNIGFYGPLINFIITAVNIWKQPIYLVGYIVTSFINVIINRVLKMTIKQERPSHGKKLVAWEHYTGAEHYGMPSLHAQSVFFSMTYLYLVKRSVFWTLVESFVASMTFYQRWKYRNHTLEQLVVGSALGSTVAYISHMIIHQYLHGQ
jgi:membrane-associated phospholipid phosphatase